MKTECFLPGAPAPLQLRAAADPPCLEKAHRIGSHYLSLLNAEFQKIARRDRKALSEKCEEMEEHYRMGNTRDLFKKIGDNKGTFHAKMGTVKDRNGKGLTNRRRRD